jgi:uncharacterized protein (DUF1330 family)
MAAYVVITRERTRNAEQMAEYKRMAPTSFQRHPVIFRTLHGRHEVLEGPALEEIIILEFPTYEDAKAWYHSPEYQEACKHRFQAGDYRFVVAEGKE